MPPLDVLYGKYEGLDKSYFYLFMVLLMSFHENAFLCGGVSVESVGITDLEPKQIRTCLNEHSFRYRQTRLHIMNNVLIHL